MKFSEGQIGRVFVIKFEDGERLPAAIEDFARDHDVSRGMCILVGGIDSGGTIIVGPEDGNVRPPIPVPFLLEGAHEVAGVGTLFPNDEGKPRLHMHAALGREGRTHTGCIRPGVDVWLIGEVILLEILGTESRRIREPLSGFEILEP